jgi:hypothetical protein
MRWSLDLAIGITRGWTATYTRGLPHDLRAERREEIDSDLWEHQRLADLQRAPMTGTATEVLFRLILGMPEDITWRLEAGAASTSKRRNSVNDTLIMRVGFLVALLPLLALVANGVGIVAGGGEWDSRTEQVLWGLAFTACPLVSIVGLWLSATMPRLGIGLVVAGVVSISLIMFWIAVITVPIGIVIIAFAVKRSGLTIWPFRPSATGTT